jgi:hypothetical protein
MRFAGAIGEAAEVELVACRVTSNQRVKTPQVVDGQIARAGEDNVLPGRNAARNIGRSAAGNSQAA